MSQTESGSHLNEVLRRIEALRQGADVGEPQPQKEVPQPQKEVPRLTEVFDGAQSLDFIAADRESLPELDTLFTQVAQLPESLVPLAEARIAEVKAEPEAGSRAMTAKQREALLKEMQPLIRAAVKKAVLSELAVLEKAIKTTLEQDMLDALRKRLESEKY